MTRSRRAAAAGQGGADAGHRTHESADAGPKGSLDSCPDSLGLAGAF